MRNNKPVINMGLFITNSSLSKGIKKTFTHTITKEEPYKYITSRLEYYYREHWALAATR